MFLRVERISAGGSSSKTDYDLRKKLRLAFDGVEIKMGANKASFKSSKLCRLFVKTATDLSLQDKAVSNLNTKAVYLCKTAKEVYVFSFSKFASKKNAISSGFLGTSSLLNEKGVPWNQVFGSILSALALTLIFGFSFAHFSPKKLTQKPVVFLSPDLSEVSVDVLKQKLSKEKLLSETYNYSQNLFKLILSPDVFEDDLGLIFASSKAYWENFNKERLESEFKLETNSTKENLSLVLPMVDLNKTPDYLLNFLLLKRKEHKLAKLNLRTYRSDFSKSFLEDKGYSFQSSEDEIELPQEDKIREVAVFSKTTVTKQSYLEAESLSSEMQALESRFSVGDVEKESSLPSFSIEQASFFPIVNAFRMDNLDQEFDYASLLSKIKEKPTGSKLKLENTKSSIVSKLISSRKKRLSACFSKEARSRVKKVKLKLHISAKGNLKNAALASQKSLTANEKACLNWHLKQISYAGVSGQVAMALRLN